MVRVMLRTKDEMNVKFSTRPLSSNLPLCRCQLYEDIVCDAKYGPVDRVWLSPGHVFVSVKQGTQLFTFDNKTTGKAHEENKGCLDLCDLHSPILDILVSSSNYSIAYVVQRNGRIQFWKFRSDLTWLLVQTFDICNVNKGEIISICLHASHSVVYWCEKRAAGADDGAVYCICKRQLPEDEEKLQRNKLGSVQAIIHNCPSGFVYATSFGVAIAFRLEPPKLSMVILWLPVTNKIVVHVGPHEVELSDFNTRQAVDFRNLAFKLVSVFVKTNNGERMKALAYDAQNKSLCVVDVKGDVKRITDTEGLEKRSKSVKVDLSDSLIDWFEHQGILGAVTSTSVSLYEEKSGKHLGTVASPDGSEITGICKLCAGTMWPAFLTKNNAYIIQKVRMSCVDYTEEILVKQKYQTKAVELAYLEQKKIHNDSTKVYEEISQLVQAWDNDGRNKPPSTKLAEIVNPYLNEYGKLEKLQQDIIRGHLHLKNICPGDIKEEVLRVLDPETSIAMTARQGWLLLLAETFPSQVQQVLMSQLEFETGYHYKQNLTYETIPSLAQQVLMSQLEFKMEDISSAQLQRWQCILANDNVESPVSTDVAVPVFEHICRLLFKIEPSRLVRFVKIAQLINDQRVGVSAFIRRRQALQFYDRALSCLPQIGESVCLEEAVAANVELLLASEQTECEMKALKICTGQQCWDQAIKLLMQKADNSFTHNRIFQTLILCMKQNGVLSQYANDVFKHMPVCKSFNSLSTVMQEDNDAKLSICAKDVFTDDTEHVTISQVRPYLLQNIQNQTDK